ncbi:hypothetical protein HETIRDRAFT_126124 [Heterobasidion irregulare TC 32-1]|uniref:DEAD-domain-containing protein n=1 Tax=Heterobasidion irregulare (strain TC 32-1) TaxID=747525 RepID=W4JRL5_HETIT|nr:uncharacterized protein HETIRDRAFT_126124 [Heterobasidion irregulare TC 32-1]ETW76217.1 hypothetical protein HETIRDRAFT_126124 [Heterobasidion irregulare TC 32-1]
MQDVVGVAPYMRTGHRCGREAAQQSLPTFKELGLIEPLLEALAQMKFKTPTPIQAQSIPHALEGRDIVGIPSTGSGKTAAFALPILQKPQSQPQGLFACQFEALGSAMGARCAVVIGGMDIESQKIALAKKPHVVVATLGRLQDIMESMKGFRLRSLKFLVLDETDRLLDMDFGLDIPTERTTYLFSATMSTKVATLQRASLSDLVRVEFSRKYQTVSLLLQYYLLAPLNQKDAYLIHLANSLAQNSIIVYTHTLRDTQRLAIMLRILGFSVIPIHVQLSQSQMLSSLGQFKAVNRKISVATDVASRDLDMPAVDIVINFDVPFHSKDHIHRVGRTPRAGRSGKSITLVTQYDIELVKCIEYVIGVEMEPWPTDKDEVALLRERVDEASRAITVELKDQARGGNKKKRGRADDDRDRDDDVVEAGMPAKRGKFKGKR